MIDKSKCICCGSCVSVCPVGAITFGPDGVPNLNKELCIQCGACQSVCPTQAIDLNKQSNSENKG